MIESSPARRNFLVPARGLNRYAVVRSAFGGTAWAAPRAYVICHC